MIVLALDPGPSRTGAALVELPPGASWPRVLRAGHVELDEALTWVAEASAQGHRVADPVLTGHLTGHMSGSGQLSCRRRPRRRRPRRRLRSGARWSGWWRRPAAGACVRRASRSASGTGCARAWS